MPTWSSMVEPQVVITTTFGATGDDKVVIKITLGFQCLHKASYHRFVWGSGIFWLTAVVGVLIGQQLVKHVVVTFHARLLVSHTRFLEQVCNKELLSLRARTPEIHLQDTRATPGMPTRKGHSRSFAQAAFRESYHDTQGTSWTGGSRRCDSYALQTAGRSLGISPAGLWEGKGTRMVTVLQGLASIPGW